MTAIGSEDVEAGLEEGSLDEIRRELCEMLDPNIEQMPKKATDSLVQAHLIWLMARSAANPDADCIYSWLTEGALAGPGHIFPPDDEE